MDRNLTHLNALYAFEASARLGSFTRAASELGVTPAAVGQHVRGLEGYLGRKLFHRTAAGLVPTEAATLALSELHIGFERIAGGLHRLTGASESDQLAISVAPALAAKWLAPRLQSLYRRCPQIDLRMETSLQFADIAGGEFDLAIRFGRKCGDGLKSAVLFNEYILPVCAPELSWPDACAAPERMVTELPLLHIEGETSDPSVLSWPSWGRQLGIRSHKLDRGPRYPHSMMALEAALNGQGVTLCGLSLVIDDLSAGRLIAPLGALSAQRTQSAYRVVQPSTRIPPKIQTTFIHWIKAEARNTNALVATFLSGK